MKIGKFGEKNNLSIDAIRHYMDLGLIIPKRRVAIIFLMSIVKRCRAYIRVQMSRI